MLNLRTKISNSMNCKVHIFTLGAFAILGLSGCNSGSTAASSGISPSDALSITSMGESSIPEGKSTHATIILKGGVLSRVDVSISSNESSVLKINPHNCTLSLPDNPTCSITLTGESQGVTNFTIKARGYPEITSESYTVLEKEASVSMSSTLPYSTTHAGIKTPVQVLFSRAINESTLTKDTFYVTDSSGGHIPTTLLYPESMSATLTFESSLAYGTKYIVYTTEGIKDLNGESVAPLNTDNTFITQQRSYTIFVSSKSLLGDLGGVTGADDLCSSDSKCETSGGSVICKAMLVTDSTAPNARQANNPLLPSWVLQPDTSYVNEAALPIGITGEPAADGTVAANPSVFAFSFQNAIDAQSGNHAWTGLNLDWSSAPDNCSNWTTAADDVNGNIGNTDSTDAQSIAAGGSGHVPCNAIDGTSEVLVHLYCVQVPQY